MYLFFWVIQCIAQTPTISINCGSPTNSCGYAFPNGSLHSYVASVSNFTACSVNACHFKWEVTNGIISGTGNTVYEAVGLTSIDVIWNNHNGNGTVKVTLSNGPTCSNCPNIFSTISIPIRYLGPVGNISINGTPHSGSVSVPCGSTPMTVSVFPVTNATNYNWILPSGWTQSGSGNSVTITPSPGIGGSISVLASRSDVPGLVTTNNLPVSRPLPQLTGISPNYEIVLCSTSDTQSGSATGANAEAFVWTPYGGVTINGSSSPVISSSSITIGGTSNGSYRVEAYSYSCGNVTSSNYQNNNVRVGVLTGVFIHNFFNGANSDEYFCSSHYGDGFTISALNGTPSSQYDVRFLSWPALNVIHTQSSGPTFNSTYTFPGGYSGYIVAEAKDNQCPGGVWSGYEIEVVNCSGSFFLSNIYPNPAKDKLIIEFKNTKNVELLPESIKIYSAQSEQLVMTVPIKEIYEKKASTNSHKITIDVTVLQSGKYFLHIIPPPTSKKKSEKIQIIIE